MKIAMIISTPFPPEEGIGYHVYNISIKLMERGHEVTVFTRGFLKTEYGNFKGIKFVKVPFLPLYPLHINIHGFFLNRQIKSMADFDIVHVHTPLPPFIKTDVPIVTTAHSSLIEDAKHFELNDFKSFVAKILTRLVSYSIVLKSMKNSKIVIAVSNSVMGEIAQYYDIAVDSVVGNAVDHNKFLQKDADGDYLLYVGRLSYRKGLFDLLSAFECVKKSKNIKLIIAGQGELKGKLKSVIKQKKLENVFFVGQKSQDELIGIYQNCKIFISPSTYESGPLTLLEAMACGKPVIATNIGISEECIDDYVNGLLINTESPNELAEKILFLLEDKNFACHIGSEARKTIEKGYTWEEVVKRVEKCYYAARGVIE